MDITWEKLEEACGGCRKCRLWELRSNVVIGDGDRKADAMFVGEGPGADEDRQGVPFVGAAGRLLNKMLEKAGFKREEIYIANVVKCRPPGNRDPHPDEREACMNYLRYQFLLVKPKMIVCLGRVAAQALIDPNFKITVRRGEWIEKKGVLFTAVYHPSAVLRDETKLLPTENDFAQIRKKYEELRK